MVENGINRLWPDEPVETVGMNNDDHPEYQLQNSKYQEYDFIKSETIFNINSFEQVGWADPFPNE